VFVVCWCDVEAPFHELIYHRYECPWRLINSQFNIKTHKVSLSITRSLSFSLMRIPCISLPSLLERPLTECAHRVRAHSTAYRQERGKYWELHIKFRQAGCTTGKISNSYRVQEYLVVATSAHACIHIQGHWSLHVYTYKDTCLALGTHSFIFACIQNFSLFDYSKKHRISLNGHTKSLQSKWEGLFQRSLPRSSTCTGMSSVLNRLILQLLPKYSFAGTQSIYKYMYVYINIYIIYSYVSNLHSQRFCAPQFPT